MMSIISHHSGNWNVMTAAGAHRHTCTTAILNAEIILLDAVRASLYMFVYVYQSLRMNGMQQKVNF